MSNFKKDLHARLLQLGNEAGQRWATDDAESSHLERVEAFLKDFDVGTPTGYGKSGDLLSVIEPRLFEGDRTAQEEFWLDCAGEEDPRDSFLLGFCQGACEIFAKVKNEV